MNPKQILKSLDDPITNFDKSLVWLFLVLTYLTILSLIVEEVFPVFFNENKKYFDSVEYLTLFVFSLEYLIRIVYSNNRLKYVTSFYGVIDALSVIPALFGVFGSGNVNGLWVRIFKVFRLVRLLKFVRLGNTVGGIVGQLIPFFATVIAFKGIIVVLENQAWWPEFQNLSIVIGVVGFTLAILLGTKLSVVHSRICAIEDSVCRIVGALRDMQNQKNIKGDLLEWSKSLEVALKSPKKMMDDMAMGMREKTDILEEKLEVTGVGGATTAGFHRDVAYLLHQATGETPPAYDKFLKYVIISYTIVVILAVPGMIGFISSVLIVYILGGIYMLIDDMDDPLSYEEHSYIDVRLDALEFYNRPNDRLQEVNATENDHREAMLPYDLKATEVI